LPSFRSSPSVFAAAPRSNSRLSLLSISWPFCADSAPVDLSFHLWIGWYGYCSIGSVDAMVLVRPATVVEWHRRGFRFYWCWRSRRPGWPRINPEIRDLIRRMSKANPLWGAPRIHGELLKLGINISQATVGRWMPWRPKVPSPTWRSFLRNHLPEIVARTCSWSPRRRSGCSPP
jgi:hypothetical protein